MSESVASPSLPNSSSMPENTPPASATGTGASATGDGVPYYEAERNRLKKMLQQKRLLERSLAITEDAIYRKETEYLEETPQGNIITGFDSYTKGSSVAPNGSRRRGQAIDMNRVFTRSSVSFKETDSPVPTAQSTPVAAMAPTPLSTTFARGEGGSNHATPTSASSAGRTGAGAANSKKQKKNGEDSEGERDAKKARTNFGATRK